MPLVSTDRPEDTGGFNRYEVDGIEVFVHKSVTTMDGVLKFRIRRFLFLTDIEAAGVKVI
jgi:hypothetical protein